ncbi:hypothetical protein HEP86_00155 [Streptomyces sp. RPA4-5]|uniref:hypothetical protein n=1 Tax=unclassified Streptomyces TaxID=2593676 RepID=UPI00143ECCE8|nr:MULTISPECIES: hypothetical protein [unclassified Streptomyces]QIY53215.1 hypothetical protein HEP86_00155 [Streptomyces sp. RPA4-5]WJY35816.1 hypothetical protein QT196_00155 [Streptomyces sp. P9-2B-2]
MSTYLPVALVLVCIGCFGMFTFIACTALRRAQPHAVPDVLRALVPLIRAMLRRRS